MTNALYKCSTSIHQSTIEPVKNNGRIKPLWQYLDIFNCFTAKNGSTATLSERKVVAEPKPSRTLSEATDGVELLKLRVVSYVGLAAGHPEILEQIRKALQEDGIVGIRGIPGYKACTQRYIEAARKFAVLPPEIKQKYIPERDSGKWLGFEIGKEKFKSDDGTEVVDKAKASYYAYVEHGTLDSTAATEKNVWPLVEECNLEGPYLEIGRMMFKTASSLLEKTSHLKERCGVDLKALHGVGRMLHYKSDPTNPNPLWCGAHYDHGFFTALLPAFYFKDGKSISEPKEAGLFVEKPSDRKYYKVVSDDPEVMLFQTGQFAQLATEGRMLATKHCVNRADDDAIERFTMAVFLNPDHKATIQSHDSLAKDFRYLNRVNDKGETEMRKDGKCCYLDWHILSMRKHEAK